MSTWPDHYLSVDWPAPARVRACSTTRRGGESLAPYDSLNLGMHVQDDPALVMRNRQRLRQELDLPAEPLWLEQVHGVVVVDADNHSAGVAADASYSRTPGRVCTVMTADCLPVLFCDRQGEVVAAAHAGWRGLVNGVLEATIQAMGCDTSDILAWLGPAIGPQAFEVGEEVREQFLAGDPAAANAFVAARAGHWLADIYQLARRRLTAQGVTTVYGGGFCTVGQSDLFYSYRRDRITGRMASLIWLAEP